MRPVTDKFLRTVRSSHTIYVRSRVCTSFQTGTNPTGTEITVIDGNVVVDGTADIRSTLDITTDGTGMWPTASNTLFTPYGNEIHIERGVQYGDGTVEAVSLGYFRIQSPEQNWPPDGPIRLSGRDRMAGLVDARLVAPAQFAAGTTLGTVVDTLVHGVYPLATIDWDDATDAVTLTRNVIAEEDRFGFLADLIRAQGKIWYWDHSGVLVINSAPDPTIPVFDVTSGPDGVLVSMSRRLTREGVYNAVVAQGEAVDTGTPVRAVAFDNNPASPTYFTGPFGLVPRFYTSPFLATTLQATDAAKAILRRGLGLPYNVDLTAIPNPALEPFDPVRVHYSDDHPDETHILESLTVPLVYSAPLTAATREQTTVIVGTS